MKQIPSAAGWLDIGTTDPDEKDANKFAMYYNIGKSKNKPKKKETKKMELNARTLLDDIRKTMPENMSKLSVISGNAEEAGAIITINDRIFELVIKDCGKLK
jgi:hypothetical protein